MQSAIRAPQSLIGPYRIVKILGRGGMGVVYLGEHGQTGDSVAIKTVFSAREATLASIRREIHALGRVRHPGVVRIVDQGVSAGLPWYAMELIRGQTLRDYIRRLWDPSMNRTTSGVGSTRLRTTSGVGSTQLNERGIPTVPLHGAAAAAATPPLPASAAVEARSLEETLTLMRSLCAPLSFLHGCGIVHRDIKPENVFIRTDGTLVLVDLGIATRFGGAEGREELVASGEVVGSGAYMAPEQIRGEFVDARADLYALGCVLHEALTGRPPFGGAGARSILEEHLFEPPTPPSHYVRGIPEALDRLTLRLLEKRARDRLGYADDVASTLGALGAERRTGAAPKPRTYLYQPPLTGRDAALLRLTVALRALQAQHRGGKIFIAGASGVGKTRLAMEVARAAVQRGIDVLTGQCVALGAADGTGDASAKAAPLHPLRPMLLAIADRCRQGGAQETARILGPRGKVLELHEPALAELPGQQDQPEPAPLPAPAARARLLACLKDTLFSLAEAAPVLIVLDDLQWIDELSLCLLGELSPAELEERGVLLVGVYRMEEVSAELAATARAPGGVQIELGRLDAASVEQMVRDMLGLRQPARALIEFLDRHCDGNPFFIAEYLRAAIDEGMVTRDDAGQWSIEEHRDRADAIETALPQPRSLAALIERRLLGLGSEPLQIAQLASVLGREFDGQLLMATAGIDERTAMDAIEVLRVRQILEESVDGRLRFVHDKLRQTAYERMPEARRRELHGWAAAAIEERQPDAPDALPILAHHFAHARIHHKASAYYARAGRRARAAHATGDAITSYRAAIDEAEACRGQGAPPLDELREGLGDVLVLAGRQEEARAAYGDALATAPEGKPVRRASLLRKIGKTWETHHDHESALRTYAAAEAVLGDAPRAGASGDEEVAWWHEWVQIQNDRVYVHYWLAQVDEMTALVAKVRPIVEERGSPAQRAHFYDDLVHLNLRRESYLASAETVQYARMARDAAVQSGDVSKAAYAWFMLAFSLLFHGDLVAAQDEMLGALAEAERTSDVPLQARCLTYLTMIHRRRGRAHETRRVGTRSLAVAVGSRMLDYVGAARANLAWAALREGDTETAERECQTAIQIWSQLSASYPYPMQWSGLWVRVALELTAGRLPGAAAAARAMLDPKQQRFPLPLEEILERSTDAYDRGDEDAARHHLEGAIVLSRDLGYV